MTASEALNRIKEHAKIHSFREPCAVHIAEALQVACEALEIRIPKKPLQKEREYNGEYGFCPNCGNIVSDDKDIKRCSACAQELDWRCV